MVNAFEGTFLMFIYSSIVTIVTLWVSLRESDLF